MYILFEFIHEAHKTDTPSQYDIQAYANSQNSGSANSKVKAALTQFSWKYAQFPVGKL